MNNIKLAVVGKDVSKSDSAAIHCFIAEKLGKSITYDKLSVPETEFENSIENIIKEYDGFNITIPFKLSVIPYLNKIVGEAKVFGAVNTVDCKSLTGYNTDGLGFELMLKNEGVKCSGKDILLLGSGGAGRSVAKKLSDGGAHVFVYDRTYERAQKLAEEFKGVTEIEEIPLKPFFAIINATGVGMHNTVGISPVGKELLSLCEVAVDLIYKPEKSEFLKIAESLGKKTLNGAAMLFYQAYYADCIYFGIDPDEQTAKKLFKDFTAL